MHDMLRFVRIVSLWSSLLNLHWRRVDEYFRPWANKASDIS
jgi:hypothetical protein